MLRESICCSSGYDGTRLTATVIAAEEPRFLFQIVHGMAEHHRRYMPFMEHLASLGGAVIAQDLRGHGETAGEENYGFFGSNAVEAVLADVHQAGEILRGRYPDLPFILFGHSMGTLIARLYAAEKDELLAGLILSGAVSHNPLVGVAKTLANLWEIFRGERHLSRTLAQLSTGSFNRAFPPSGEPAAEYRWLSANPETRIAYAEDPACGFPFTVNGHGTMFSFMKEAYSPKNWNVHNRDMPVLFLSGEEDPVMTDAAHFADAVQFMRDMGYRNVESRLYPGMRHEILQETGRDDVYRDVEAFLEKILCKNADSV